MNGSGPTFQHRENEKLKAKVKIAEKKTKIAEDKANKAKYVCVSQKCVVRPVLLPLAVVRPALPPPPVVPFVPFGQVHRMDKEGKLMKNSINALLNQQPHRHGKSLHRDCFVDPKVDVVQRRTRCTTASRNSRTHCTTASRNSRARCTIAERSKGRSTLRVIFLS